MASLSIEFSELNKKRKKGFVVGLNFNPTNPLIVQI
jgi:hypothetical protein